MKSRFRNCRSIRSGLTVADVRAHVALDANIDLDNVARIVNRVVQTLDRNPQILIQVLKTVDTAVTSITGPTQPTR